MKKMLIMVVALGIGWATQGCKKVNEDLTNSDNTNTFKTSLGNVDYKIDKTLVFQSREDYFNLVNAESLEERQKFCDEVNAKGFKNYLLNPLHASLEKNSSIQEMDDFFGQLLNTDGCIQIGEHVFKIDLSKEKVFCCLSEKIGSCYQDLVDGNLNNKDILAFSLNDDVFDLLDNGGSEKCPNPSGFQVETKTNENTQTEFHTYLRLFSAGIYYRVTGRTKRIGSFINRTWEFRLSVVNQTGSIRRRPCSSTQTDYHYVGLKSITQNQNEPTWEAYSKAWNVQAMTMYLQTVAIITENGGNSVWNYGPVTGISF